MNNINRYLRRVMAVCLVLAFALFFLGIGMWLEGTIYYPVLLLIHIVMIVFILLTIRSLRAEVTSEFSELLRETNKVKAINSDLEGITRSMVHDLKSPLRSMGSFAQLAIRRMPEGEEEIREYLSYITNNANRMSHLLDAIGNFSKINSDDYMKEEVVLDELMDEVKLNILDKINEKNVKISTFNLPVVNANQFQLMQVLQNLLENAIKYNNEKRPEVVFSGKETATDYIISVEDNGIGIEDDYKEKIFELFHRLNPHLYEGTGVGLAICKKIIESHKGKIWLEPKEGSGTIFCFTLPKAPAVECSDNNGVGAKKRQPITSEAKV